MMAYLGPVTSTYTIRNTERYPFSILPFGVTAMRAAVGRLQQQCHRSQQASSPPPSYPLVHLHLALPSLTP